MVWLKNCWSFSLTRLIQICSKVLNSKISNPGDKHWNLEKNGGLGIDKKPAMSRTPMKLTFFMVGSILWYNCKSSGFHVWNLQCSVTHVNDEPEETPINIFDDRTDSDRDRCHVLGFAHPLSTNLYKISVKVKVFNHRLKSRFAYSTLYLGLMKQS